MYLRLEYKKISLYLIWKDWNMVLSNLNWNIKRLHNIYIQYRSIKIFISL